MRIAIYGGNFNPPHVGHAMVCAWLGWTKRVDEAWLLPSYAHPFQRKAAPFELRLALCRAMAEAVGSWVRVCDLERELPTPSYTLDVLEALASRHPEHTFRLVVGADTLETAHAWKGWERIQDRFAPVVVGRQGWPVPAGTLAFPEVSSTEVRRRLRAGDPVDHLVPSAVLEALPSRWEDEWGT